jgi:hypothetical protein
MIVNAISGQTYLLMLASSKMLIYAGMQATLIISSDVFMVCIFCGIVCREISVAKIIVHNHKTLYCIIIYYR